MWTTGATIFTLELLLGSVCVFDWVNLQPPSRLYHSLLVSDTLALLPLCFLPSIPAFPSPSLPLSLAFTCSLFSGEITTAQKRCPAAVQCSALLCPPSAHTAHICTYKSTPTYKKGSSASFLPLKLPLFWVLLRTFSPLYIKICTMYRSI